MALEYQLSYTAEEIDNRLGTVNENAGSVENLEKNLTNINAEIADLILNKVPKTRLINGKVLDADINLTAEDVYADVKGSAEDALDQAKDYINSQMLAEQTARITGDDNTLDAAMEYVDAKFVTEEEARANAINLAVSTVKEYADTEIAKEASDRDNAISIHNTSTTAHNDIRLLISDLITRINTLLDSDDTTLDQMSEIVAYIQNNKNLIDGITTNKVNVIDIIDNLTSAVSNKPLSANQGKVLKELIDKLQILVNNKADSIHTHLYAGSAIEGGSANSAVKLDSSAGSVTQPVYFHNGQPIAINYTIQSNVPSDAKFTDTTYSVMNPATSTTAGENGLVPAPGIGDNKSFLRGDGKWEIPENTTYNEVTTTTHGLMSAADKSKLDSITASADAVSFAQSLTSGIQIGTININGTATKLYAPTKPNISVNSSEELVITT